MKPFANPPTFENAKDSAILAFERYFADDGERVFDYGVLDGNVQALFETPQISGYKLIGAYCDMAGRPELKDRCVVEFLEIDEFQAYAATSDGCHFVGISAALPILVQVMFQELVKMTNPFSEEIGEDSTFWDFPTDMPVARLPTGDFGRRVESMLLDTMPEERWQKVLSTKLAELAVLFCVTHEIGHLVRGHSRIAEKRSMSAIAEVGRRAGVSDSVRQAWELQADHTAIAFVYSYVVNNAVYRSRLLSSLLCDSSRDPRIELMGRVVYAVSLVFFLLGQRQRSVDAIGSHPSAITRQTFVMAQVVSLLCSERVRCDEEEAERVVTRSARRAELAWNRIGYRFGDFSESIDDLASVVKRMQRAKDLCEDRLKGYGWGYGDCER